MRKKSKFINFVYAACLLLFVLAIYKLNVATENTIGPFSGDDLPREFFSWVPFSKTDLADAKEIYLTIASRKTSYVAVIHFPEKERLAAFIENNIQYRSRERSYLKCSSELTEFCKTVGLKESQTFLLHVIHQPMLQNQSSYWIFDKFTQRVIGTNELPPLIRFSQN